jgi:parvulin-like peptidyl-prolyl isomerase
MNFPRRFFREPLVHFLLLGGLLFLYFEWRGGAGGPGGSRIAITPGLVQHLAAGFSRTWQRPPTDAELKGLVDEYVKEEIATREAVGMGLDRDDTIIRRRLRQKLEFLAEDAAVASPPSDTELQAWLDAHPESFQAEPQLAFRQVYLSPERRGAKAAADAAALLARLQQAGPDAATDHLGDPSMLPAEEALIPLRDVERSFGADFAQALLAIQPGRWSGPVESPYGLHLVVVREHVAPVAPTLAEIRPMVEREVLSERRLKVLDTLYETLLQQYTVTIEMPSPATSPAPAAAAGGSGSR